MNRADSAGEVAGTAFGMDDWAREAGLVPFVPDRHRTRTLTVGGDDGSAGRPVGAGGR
jgi:hypothetical protein